MKDNQKYLLIIGALILLVILIGNQYDLFSVKEFNKLPSQASGHSEGAIQVPMFSTQCTKSGYDFCYEDSYSYGSAKASPKIYWSFLDDTGRFWNEGHNNYAIGSLYYQAGFTGDKIYHFRDSNPLTSWDNVNCNENGCSGLLPVSTSKIKIASLGQEFTECMGFIAWDRDDSGGYWAWTWAGYGWLGSGNCVDIRVVNCYDDSDCSGGKICDKTGIWQSWSCKEAPEVYGYNIEDNLCVYVEDGQYETLGECIENLEYECYYIIENKCIEYNDFSQCMAETLDNYNTLSECESNLIIYECETKVDCPTQEEAESCGPFICQDNECVFIKPFAPEECLNTAIWNDYPDCYWECLPVEECESGEVKCVGKYYYKCISESWINQGKVSGYCGYSDEPFNLTKFLEDYWMYLLGVLGAIVLISFIKK